MSERERDRIVAIIPALDEEEALPEVLRGLRAGGVSHVVVADNGSTDGTAAVARAEGARVVQESERGYGAACLAALAEVERLGWDPAILVFLDGDGSDDPEALPLLLDPIRGGRADLVVGIRSSGQAASGTERGLASGAVPWHARAGNALILGGARLLHRVRLRDLGPFRAVRREALEVLEMDDRNWGWTLQMQLRAHHAGLRVLEVPVPHRTRRGGRSKISGSVSGSIRAGTKMMATLFTELPRVRRRVTRGRSVDSPAAEQGTPAPASRRAPGPPPEGGDPPPGG